MNFVNRIFTTSERRHPIISLRKLSETGRFAFAPFFLLFANAIAHAQGTMDFSGVETLMRTFRTFAIYAGAVICFGGLIFAGIRMMSGRFQNSPPTSSVTAPTGSPPWMR